MKSLHKARKINLFGLNDHWGMCCLKNDVFFICVCLYLSELNSQSFSKHIGQGEVHILPYILSIPPLHQVLCRRCFRSNVKIGPYLAKESLPSSSWTMIKYIQCHREVKWKPTNGSCKEWNVFIVYTQSK